MYASLEGKTQPTLGRKTPDVHTTPTIHRYTDTQFIQPSPLTIHYTLPAQHTPPPTTSHPAPPYRTFLSRLLPSLVDALVAVLEEVAHHVDEAALVSVGAVGRALHEQPPVRVALARVGGVGVANLPVVVQERRKLWDEKRTEKEK